MWSEKTRAWYPTYKTLCPPRNVRGGEDSKKQISNLAKQRGWWEASSWYSKSGRCKDREYLKRVAHDSRPISIKPKQVIEWKSVKNKIFEKVRKPGKPNRATELIQRNWISSRFAPHIVLHVFDLQVILPFLWAWQGPGAGVQAKVSAFGHWKFIFWTLGNKRYLKTSSSTQVWVSRGPKRSNQICFRSLLGKTYGFSQCWTQKFIKIFKNVDFSRVANSQRGELCHWNHESTVETDDKEYFGLESARQK